MSSALSRNHLLLHLFLKKKGKSRSTESKESHDKKQEEKIVHQAFLEAKAEYVKALMTFVLTAIQNREQPIQTPKEGQEQVKAEAQAQTSGQAGKQIAELGKAPQPIHRAFIAQLSGQTVQLEEIAKVNAWRSFNGTDILSSPKDKSQPDERLAQLGRSLVETKNLIGFNKPTNNILPEISKFEWTKDIQSITNQNDVLSITQKQVLTQLIDRKVQTLQAVLRRPELTNQAANLFKDEKALNAFLVQTETRMFPTSIHIPAEALQRNQMTPRATDALAEQAARQQFPSEDSLSLLGRQLVQAQSYLDKGKVKEAQAFLDPAKSGANAFADWLKPFANVDFKDPKTQIMLSDKLAAVSEIVRGMPREQEPQLQLINTKFLNLMQANIASRRDAPLPLELEASRQATLYFVRNPGVIDHVIQDKTEAEVRSIYQNQIIRKATDLYQQLSYSDKRYNVRVGTQPDTQIISDTVTEITAPKVTEPSKPTETLYKFHGFRQSQITLANIDNTSATPIVSKAETVIAPTLISYYETANYQAASGYSNVNIPTPFQSENRLTGKGTNLDGANRGVMASGGHVRASNASFLASTASPFIGPSSKHSNSSMHSSSNLNTSSASSASAGNAASASAFGGSGLLIGFQPSWHHGFLNPLRGGGFNLNGLNPFGTDDDEEEKEDKENNDSNNNNEDEESVNV